MATSSNPLRSKKSNLELSPVATRRPSSAPHERWSANDEQTTEAQNTNKTSPLFINKFGKRHHAFPKSVPWPISYEREVLDLDVLNYQFLKKVRGLTFVDVSKGPPMRILDVGTGVGSWVIDAAQQWTESQFVGLDIVPIQPDLETISLDESVRKRIRWVHGNFLQKLPFDDASFDYVRCVNLAKGIPEDKWVSLFEEISRVMAPNASLEIIVENIVFPYVSRIAPPSPAPSSAPAASPSVGEFAGIPRHDHYFLEQVFFDVFERRFINVRPTKIVSNYLNMHFRQVTEYPIQLPTSPEGTPSSSPSKSSEEDLSLWANEIRAWQAVLGCRESMWDEVLLKSTELGGQIIESLPWTKLERSLTPRHRFETLFERYEREMRDRTALSMALTRGIGWAEPGKEPESPLDVHEGLDNLNKERIRLSQSNIEDIDPSVLVSCFVGLKGDF